ncbi:Uncharacterised protein [Mycobacteroides abscessus subsp. abscessus]|nr:Uncharacterised protein [Mycobacteroides abscessus subsp. abscessus]
MVPVPAVVLVPVVPVAQVAAVVAITVAAVPVRALPRAALPERVAVSAAAQVVAAAVDVPVSAVVRQVRSVVPVAPRSVVASPSGRNAPNTRTCRRLSSVACGCRMATVRSSGSRAAPRSPISPRRSMPTQRRWCRRCSTSARW